jgi:glycosyltransferase involved in cell wall biosynthesis
MAEKVKDGVNGLHFRARDPISLSQAVSRAISTPQVWQSLRQGIPDVYRMMDHVESLSSLYQAVLARKHSADAVAVRS